MEDKLVPGPRPDGEQLLAQLVSRTRKGPLRTHIPPHAPKWFTDYVKSVEMWCADVHSDIRQLYDARR